MTIQIESHPPVEAAHIGYAHIELNPDHRLLVFLCPGCAEPLGMFCGSCNEPLCAITTPDCKHSAS